MFNDNIESVKFLAHGSEDGEYYNDCYHKFDFKNWKTANDDRFDDFDVENFDSEYEYESEPE